VSTKVVADQPAAPGVRFLGVGMRGVILLVMLATLSSCKVAEDAIACGASDYWECPLDSVVVESLGANSYAVSGCEKEMHVSCKGPADGCIIKAGSEIFPTRQCIE